MQKNIVRYNYSNKIKNHHIKINNMESMVTKKLNQRGSVETLEHKHGPCEDLKPKQLSGQANKIPSKEILNPSCRQRMNAMQQNHSAPHWR